MNVAKLASIIDHTNLRSSTTEREIDILCNEAIDFGFASVCVYGYWVDHIKESYPQLRTVQVLNFPSGLSLSHVETLSQVNSSADEYDIVMNISKLREKKYTEVKSELRQARSYIGRKVLKVIVESGVLSSDDLLAATALVAEVGADFIKTSTGFVPQSDTQLFDQVATIKSFINLHRLQLEIKASGGIRTLEQVRMLIGLGVSRIGTSSSISILKELEGRAH